MSFSLFRRKVLNIPNCLCCACFCFSQLDFVRMVQSPTKSQRFLKSEKPLTVATVHQVYHIHSSLQYTESEGGPRLAVISETETPNLR
jgi:hypothetical protein